MHIKSRTEIAIDKLDQIFGPPTIHRGDDRSAYDALRQAIFDLYEPEDIMGLMQVQQIVDDRWQVARYQRLSTRYVDGNRRRAFAKMAHRWGGFVDEVGEVYFEKCKLNKIGIPSEQALKPAGLSRDLIDAKALLLAASKIAVIDDLIANRNAASKAAHNDYERNRRLKSKQKPIKAASVMKAESDNDNGSVGRWGPKKDHG